MRGGCVPEAGPGCLGLAGMKMSIIHKKGIAKISLAKLLDRSNAWCYTRIMREIISRDEIEYIKRGIASKIKEVVEVFFLFVITGARKYLF